MMMQLLLVAAATVQSVPPAPIVVQPEQTPPGDSAVLPANTAITLAMNDTITTKGNRWHTGDNFDLTVTYPARISRYTVIPRGAKGVGRITWMTDKGAFGKSGKMEVDLEYVEVAGQRIPLSGHYRQEGEGNTVATIGAVVAVGVFSAFVTGKSGVIPAGRELVAHTKEDVAVVIPRAADTPQPAFTPAPASTPDGTIVAVDSAPRRVAPVPRTPAQFGNRRIRCITC